MDDSHSGLGDPLPLAQALIRCASVTPADAGAQDVLADALGRLGFTVHRLRFGEIENLFARLGTGGPHICFAGHTDVVPVGAANWRLDPFGGEVRDGVLYGRGACDMKGAIAAFAAGVAQHLEQGVPRGSISFLITGDEEGPATDGTIKVLEWMRQNDQVPDFCLVGEPTCPVKLGDMVKIGRRGSVNMKIEIHGTQGHVAYPHRADNPVHRLIRALDALTSVPIDAGTDWFEQSSLQVTSIDVGNGATNVIPASARAALNIRFNDGHSGNSLTAWVKATLARYADRFDLESSTSGESFVTKPGPLVDILCDAIRGATGVEPKLDTGGGTSDARFIARYCPVAEFGLVGATMHQTDECVPVAELRDLARIYRGIVAAFSGMNRGGSARKSILLGIVRIARGRADGIASFGASSQAFLSSLAPLVAFPLVGAVLGSFSEGPRRAFAGFAMTLCALLTPPVVSYELARFWKRDQAWVRFATAFNWCEWILPVAACLIMLPLSVAISMGMDENAASLVLLGCLGAYGLWLHWFLARNGLALSRLRAVLLVFLVNLATVAAVMGPRLLVRGAW